MSSNFTIEGRRLAQMPDIQRTYLWEWIIPDAGQIAPGIIAQDDDLTIKCRNASIPGRGTDMIESNFMSMKQYFMGRPNIETNVSTIFEETEDQQVMLFFYAWRQAMCNIGPTPDESVTSLVSETPGAAALPSKRQGLTKTCFLRMYKYDGTVLPYQIKFVHAWPENVDNVSMDYGTSESVKYNVSWRFDYWQLVATSAT